jgi:cell division protease FtsH
MDRQHSETTAAAIDEEISKLLRSIERYARNVLEQHRDALETLANALEARETLEVEDIREILADQIRDEGQSAQGQRRSG